MTTQVPGQDAAPEEDEVTTSAATEAPTSPPPRHRARGVFAERIQGATPKYAHNRGFRNDTQHRNSLARIFVRVDRDEYETFLNSIGDDQVRGNLADRIAGDPTSPRRRGESVHNSGYVDFLITQSQMQLQEKYEVSETLSDNYVAYFFGQSAPVFTYSGYLINTNQDDQATNFLRLYIAILRGTQLARRQKIASLRYDSYIVAGAMTNLNMTLLGANELLIPFSFQFLVKKLVISKFTRGWTPTRVDGPFAADPLLVPYDGRPRSESALQAILARTPPGTVAGPNGDAPEHERLASEAPENTTDSHANVSGAGAPVSTAASATTARTETQTSTLARPDPNVRPRLPMARTETPTVSTVVSPQPRGSFTDRLDEPLVP